MVKVGTLKLDLDTRKLYLGRRWLRLRNQETILLAYFMGNCGQVLSRTRILEEAWDCNICCATNTVDVHISTLRRKIHPFTGKHLIKTVHCTGYVFEP